MVCVSFRDAASPLTCIFERKCVTVIVCFGIMCLILQIINYRYFEIVLVFVQFHDGIILTSINIFLRLTLVFDSCKTKQIYLVRENHTITLNPNQNLIIKRNFSMFTCTSMLSMSVEKRLSMRPSGVTSKKAIGARMTRLRRRSWSVTDARTLPRYKMTQKTNTDRPASDTVWKAIIYLNDTISKDLYGKIEYCNSKLLLNFKYDKRGRILNLISNADRPWLIPSAP